MKRYDNYLYQNGILNMLLRPISWLFCLLVLIRRLGYRLRFFRSYRINAPVIVIGNITVGGSGKTPLVTWLAQVLKEAGYTPGVVSRGYGGKARYWPQQVRPDSDPTVVGDEAVLLASRCGCAMAVGPDRAKAARTLLEHTDCDVIISDDGMQHYRLRRDIEVAVIDGVRRLGNGLCLPAGPLREPERRLKSVDFIVTNGLAMRGEHAMRLRGTRLLDLHDETNSKEISTMKGQRVHAVAGIGNPTRFYNFLRKQGIDVIEHIFPDHHEFKASDIEFDDELPLLMTEKDAVKCCRLTSRKGWYIPVEAQLDTGFREELLGLLKSKNDG